MKKIKPKNRKNYKVVFVAKLKKIKKNASLLLLLVAILYLVWTVVNAQFFQAKINISSSYENIDIQELYNSVNDLTKLPLDIPQIKIALLQHHWVKDISIKRVWNTLNIDIIPQQVVFNWRNLENSNKGYINQDGELFIPSIITQNTHTTIVSNKEDIPTSFKHLMKYQQTFTAKIKTFVVKNIESLILPNGATIILGMEKQEEKLQKLQKYYHKFKMRPNSIVDLRYENGFAKTN